MRMLTTLLPKSAMPLSSEENQLGVEEVWLKMLQMNRDRNLVRTSLNGLWAEARKRSIMRGHRMKWITGERWRPSLLWVTRREGVPKFSRWCLPGTGAAIGNFNRVSQGKWISKIYPSKSSPFLGLTNRLKGRKVAPFDRKVQYLHDHASPTPQ